MKSLCILVALVAAVQAANICNPTTAKPATLTGRLPSDFVVDIEVVQTENKKVQNVRMYYLKQLNMIRMDTLDAGVKTTQFYYFNQDEILTFNHKVGRGTCTVTHGIEENVDAFMFGGMKKGQNPPEIPVVMAAIHFIGRSGFPNDAEIKEIKKDDQNIRAKEATVYQSCQRWTSPNNDIVLKVNHLFAGTSKLTYTFPWEDHLVAKDFMNLLQIRVEGTGTVNGKSDVYIKHFYNYYNLKGSVANADKLLETPEGIVCAGRKVTKTFPKLPTHISFTAETIDSNDHSIETLEESYDYTRLLGIIRTPIATVNGEDVNRVQTVLNFKTGIQYRVDSQMGVCVSSNINTSHINTMFYSVKNGKASMFNPAQFFRADSKNFAYLGPKKLRGLDADSFVAQSSDFPNDPNAVIQWHFAQKVSSWNNGNTDYETKNWAYPLKYKFWPDLTSPSSLAINIYHVDFKGLRGYDLDLTNCFSKKQHFQMVLTGSKKQIVKTDLRVFKNEIANQIEKVSGVQLIQINQIKLYYTKEDLVVEFFIVGDQPVQADKIATAIKQGKLTLTVVDPKTKKRTMKLAFDKVKSVYVDKNVGSPLKAPQKKSSTRYTGGAMAGLGVAMIIVGLAGGVGIGFAHTKFFTIQ